MDLTLIDCSIVNHLNNYTTINENDGGTEKGLLEEEEGEGGRNGE